MDIYAKSGTKVKFKGQSELQLNWGGFDDANRFLAKDKVYTVFKTIVYSSKTAVILKEFPDKKFNSSIFY